MYRLRAPVDWASPADLPGIAALDAVASPDPFGESHLLRYCEQGERSIGLVCRNGSRLEGFVLLSLVLDEASIDNIAVHPAAQGRGLGGVLLGEALAVLRDRRVQRCVLDVRASNAPALALYRRYSFGEDGRRPGYYTTATGREDAVLMSRSL
ncbi:ribosomal protein S18-alanine N-acetyltransferase [Haliea sp. E17]|uniref:ribosomal protein S18-alanine N-acetyltransferase n=1 Tax=Haliea sp. E17 TaxID=3401576 RepID=UPI003AAEF95E